MPRWNLFMSHAWRHDSSGRDTHSRVRALKSELGALGWAVWFDEEQLFLGKRIDVCMCEGIRDSDAVCVCLTRAYIEKVNAQQPSDNVAKEFNFAHRLGKNILPIVMERDLLQTSNWPHGLMTMYLGSTFFLDATGDDMAAIAFRLSSMLHLLGLRPVDDAPNNSPSRRNRPNHRPGSPNGPNSGGKCNDSGSLSARFRSVLQGISPQRSPQRRPGRNATTANSDRRPRWPPATSVRI